ncbi:MAG: hypothetical protein HY719_16805 [Planctomycetes bacterium]|nr:hypothetical protein [Planctomycetota bacterium]
MTPLRRIAVYYRVLLPSCWKKVSQRLNELCALEENWDSYGAPRINPRVGTRVLALLSNVWKDPNISDTVPAPHVFPALNGGVQLEWWGRGWDIEVEVAPDDTPLHAALFVEEPKEEKSAEADEVASFLREHLTQRVVFPGKRGPANP